ncbi:MAG: hypothetical protein APF76_14355 [Desulfitibacter sp. BRH_c19]|nr:MAG: hypothetical protein APF76_14355 [Desulfitibacter sp. BRH_c19]
MQVKKLILSVFLISLSLFTYEISLIRLFSTLMWYQFVYLAISIAILALGLGGILVYKIKNDNQLYYDFTAENILERSSLLLALSITAVIFIIYKAPFFTLASYFYILLGSFPFIFGGMFLAESFHRFTRKSSYIYFADLVGSGVGSILIIMLLDNYSIAVVSLFISLFALVAYFLLKPIPKSLTGVLSVLILGLILLLSGSTLDRIIGNFSAYSGNAKMLGQINGNSKSVFTTWNSFARTDVIETDSTEDKIVLIDGSAASRMIPFDGDLNKVAYLKEEIGYLPFAVGDNSNSLVIGSGGGMDLVLAKLAGIEDITAVEINKGSIEAVREFADFNGRIYDLPGTRVFNQDGRTFVTQNNGSYDVIYLSMVMTQAAETIGYALSENYIYTVEAFSRYLNLLNTNGKLGLVLHVESELQKAIATSVKALEDRGLSREEAVNSIAYLNNNHGMDSHSRISYPLLIVKKEPFTKAEAEQLQLLADETGKEILHLPYLQPDKTLVSQNMSSWVVTDNSPFFYNSGGNTIPVTILLILATIFFIGRKALRPYKEQFREPTVKPFYNYFILLGVGFMLIEIPLIQVFILFLGNPILTFTLVIAAILTSGGLGSLLGAYLKKLPVTVPAAFIVIYTLFLTFALSNIFVYFQGGTLQFKVLLTILIILPLGLALGIPFPKGLIIMADRKNKDLIPLMWGVNGWTSVLGSILALIIAMMLGINWTLGIGALLYLIFIINYQKLINTQVSE